MHGPFYLLVNDLYSIRSAFQEDLFREVASSIKICVCLTVFALELACFRVSYFHCSACFPLSGVMPSRHTPQSCWLVLH